MGKNTSDFPLQEYYTDIVESYDRVNRIFTFGQDRVWRKKAAKECLAARPHKVLDLCAGTGDFVMELARHSGKDREFTAFDFTPAMLEKAREKYSRLEGSNEMPAIEFLEGDVADMPFRDDAFDAIGITFGIRNLVYENSKASMHLAEIRRVLRPGGELVILESARPASGWWRFVHMLYLNLILPYLGGLLSGNLKAYRYLATSSRNYYSLEEMADLLEGAGFEPRRSRALFQGSVMLLVAGKK